MEFSKYTGSGNDFIFLDQRKNPLELSKQGIKFLCDRKNGVGADGLITLEAGEIAPYRMRIFNADGSEAEMCGNGLRCFKRFLEDCGIRDKTIQVQTFDRVLSVSNYGIDIKAEMGPPKDLRLDVDLGNGIKVDIINTGVPHAVRFVSSIDDPEIFNDAPMIRNHPKLMPGGVNVNVAEIRDDKLWVRTWERGVEGETLACGTGMVASALIAAIRFQRSSPQIVVPLSKEEVVVEFKIENQKITEASQIGPARFIFQGYCHYALQKREEAFC